MKLLLDTHALLWWLKDDGQLGARARALIADPGNDVLVSAASLWEIVVKVRIGKLEADIEEISEAVERGGFTLLGISAAHLAVLGGLPLHPGHRDPFDHLLIAQAITEGATFLSEDRNAPRYPVRIVTCSDSAAPYPSR
ncbi:type II toxin-antitoxin system VapC family toxin [Roseicella aquatilis]|uniref:Type II toxin-antitoxin system VapC family toxin n=1 Tax=Roseicella aquatilis TaxID=2527868 RepID=A0A4R4DWZ5_9PROT|nr:type II toxin-antitoxin system VapC family toxin [Roseicella aquatilis]TCZ66051.1 type II toxin-antitoxin system VapC family toxin [Roseicella aquatilis]